MFKNIIEDLGINDKLYEKPKEIKGVNQPHIRVEHPHHVIQIDLLELPNDNNYKYALVAVDLNTRKVDAEPIMNKTANTTLEGIKKIFNRGIVKQPKLRIECDSGLEFKGVFAKYMQDNNIHIRYGKSGRSKMQSMVENRNKTIGKALFMYMHSVEQVHGTQSNEWTSVLPKIINIINKHIKPHKVKETNNIQCQGDTCNVLEVGTKVRLKLDKPERFITGKKEHGEFRAGDQRFSPVIRTIKQILLKPDQPPMYLLDGNKDGVEPVAYTKEELQIVKKNGLDVEPDAEKLGIDPNSDKQFLVKNILNKKKVNNKILYLVSWVGFGDKHNTWEPAKNIPKNLLDKYNNK